jgi:hypothetical protein
LLRSNISPTLVKIFAALLSAIDENADLIKQGLVKLNNVGQQNGYPRFFEAVFLQ